MKRYCICWLFLVIILSCNRQSSSIPSYFDSILWNREDEVYNFREYYERSHFTSQRQTEIEMVTHNLCESDRKFPRQFSIKLRNDSDGRFSIPGVFSLLGTSIEVNLSSSTLLVKLLLYTERINNLTSVEFLDQARTTHCFCVTQVQLPDLELILHSRSVVGNAARSQCTTREAFLPKMQQSKELVIYCNLTLVDDQLPSIMKEKEVEIEILESNSRFRAAYSLCAIQPFTKSIATLPFLSQENIENNYKARPVARMVACSQPLYNVDYLESLWPGIMTFWVIHHLFVAGMSSFSIYDIDGSAEKYLTDFIRLGLVEYYPRFHLTHDLYFLTVEANWPYCAQTFIENHCLWSYRGLAEWVVFVHAPDLYLFDGSLGGSNIYNEFHSLNESFVGLTWEIFDQLIDYQSIDPLKQSIFEIFLLAAANTTLSTPTSVAMPHRLDVLYLHSPAHGFYPNDNMTLLNTYPAKHFITLFSNRSYDTIQASPGVHLKLSEILRVESDLVKCLPWIHRAYSYLQWILHGHEVSYHGKVLKLRSIEF